MPDWQLSDLDPHAAALYERARSKPEAVEEHPWGDTVFKVGGKSFVFMSTPPGPSVSVKVPPEDVEPLLQLPYIARSHYIGRYGWLTIRVEDDEALELALGMIDDSYEIRAPKRLRQTRKD
jgi:predicted DNA-binding protein (MmcQ/YjbR family)